MLSCHGLITSHWSDRSFVDCCHFLHFFCLIRGSLSRCGSISALNLKYYLSKELPTILWYLGNHNCTAQGILHCSTWNLYCLCLWIDGAWSPCCCLLGYLPLPQVKWISMGRHFSSFDPANHFAIWCFTFWPLLSRVCWICWRFWRRLKSSISL